jgi:hypothetical protein
MHTKCDERTDGRIGVKQYAPHPDQQSRGHNNNINMDSITAGSVNACSCS